MFAKNGICDFCNTPLFTAMSQIPVITESSLESDVEYYESLASYLSLIHSCVFLSLFVRNVQSKPKNSNFSDF